MKIKLTNFRTLLIALLLLICKLSNAQTFDVYIANDFPTSTTTYEFDVFIKSTDPAPWGFRTIQFGFYVNPSWLPAGPAPTIIYISASTGLVSYSPGLIQMNAAPSLSAFQIAANSAGTCGANTTLSQGSAVKIGRFRIVSNSGPMNCIAANISMIRPIVADVAPGGNVNLKMVVTRWTDVNCGVLTSTTISGNGTYTSIAGGTLLTSYNNMAPSITSPANFTACEGGTSVFTVSVIPNAGPSGPTTYQWFDNGVLMPGQQAATLSISNTSLSLNTHAFTCQVIHCNSILSNPGILTVIPASDGNACTIDACNTLTGTSTHTPINTNDNNVCTTDGCNTLTGPFNTPINVNDNDACTTDGCNTITGPFYIPVDINDNNLCTTDACDAILGISHTAVNTDDGNSSTTDGCDPALGVYHYASSSTGISYQAVARNNAGDAISNQNISVRFSIRDVIPTGSIVYQEKQNVQTNLLGLFTVNIGIGTPVIGIFSAIDWTSNSKFLQVELDTNGGNAFIQMGIQQMMSVPYALYAVKSGSTTTINTSFSSYLASNISLSPSSIIQITFNTTLFNYGNGFNNATGKFTAPITGVYQFIANINFLRPSTNTEAILRYFKNGSPVTGGQSSTILSSLGTIGSTLTLSIVLDLNQGDIIDVRAQQNGSGTLSIFGGGTQACTFSGFKVN